ncbi:MAG TPA: hypothetical protein VLK89_08310 [Solirubrobacterales bacterium]|nr:hypothetical protein [Solirubrobacterales bacterium]
MRYASVALVLAALAVAGCGQSGQTGGEAATKPRQPPGQALTQGQVMSVHLGTPRAATIASLGPPSATGPKTIAGDRCLYWRIQGHPASVALWRLCFRAGRLHVVATYIR